MKFSFFYHSLVSEWNNPNAHFLRGMLTDLIARGHEVQVYEPNNGYSRKNLLQHHGLNALDQFYNTYPHLVSFLYDRQTLNMERVAAESDVIVVHDWNESWVINGFGELRNKLQAGNNADQSFQLLFHDTQHRSVTDAYSLSRLKLEFYDGILAYQNALVDIYHTHGFNNVWTLHQAADTRVFYPRDSSESYASGDAILGDVVWISNWNESAHTQELKHFLLDPICNLQLTCNLYGAHYNYDKLNICEPLTNISTDEGRIKDHGWLASFNTPQVYANHSVAVHVPYCDSAKDLTLTSTNHLLEAMACGIPLISAQNSQYSHNQELFTPGEDFLIAHNSADMQRHLYTVVNDKDYAQHLADRALRTILNRHTCIHRVDQLLEIIAVVNNTHDKFSAAQTTSMNHQKMSDDFIRMHN